MVVFGNQAMGLQFFQPLGEHGRGNTANAPLEIVEAVGAVKQLTQNQYRPLLSQDFRRFGDGTELCVVHSRAVPDNWNNSLAFYYRFCTLAGIIKIKSNKTSNLQR